MKTARKAECCSSGYQRDPQGVHSMQALDRFEPMIRRAEFMSAASLHSCGDHKMWAFDLVRGSLLVPVRNKERWDKLY